MGGEEIKPVLFVEIDCPGIIVSVYSYKAAAGLVPYGEECLYEIHDLCPDTLAMELLINTEPAYFNCRETSEMFFVRYFASYLSENAFFAVFAAYSVVQDTKKGDSRQLILKDIRHRKELTKIVKGIFIEKLVKVGITAIKRFYFRVEAKTTESELLDHSGLRSSPYSLTLLSQK